MTWAPPKSQAHSISIQPTSYEEFFHVGRAVRPFEKNEQNRLKPRGQRDGRSPASSTH